MVQSEDCDIHSVSALAVVKFLIDTVQSLADNTGDIPPTPPASRPPTPSRRDLAIPSSPPPGPVPPATPISPISPTSNKGIPHPPPSLPSPEAHRDEPLPCVGADAESVSLQQAAISRRFFLKTAPPFSLSQYLLRIHHYCPHSPGVYLTAACYIHRLCIEDALVPATGRTVHRLCLAAIRVASKALEDHKWSQERYMKVGGVSKKELRSLEINICFLLGFDLLAREGEIKKRVWGLQQAAVQGAAVKRRLSGAFRMKLPTRGVDGSAVAGAQAG